MPICDHRRNTAVMIRVHPDICPFPTDGGSKNTVQYCQSGHHAYPNYTALQKSLFCLINTLCLAGTVFSSCLSDIKVYFSRFCFWTHFMLALIVLHHLQSVINLYSEFSLCLFECSLGATWILNAHNVLTYHGTNKEGAYLFYLLLGRMWWGTIPNENLTPFKLYNL